MSGYKEDIISILKHKLLYHNKSIGAVVCAGNRNTRAFELYSEIHKKHLVTDNLIKGLEYDYIIFLHENVSTPNTLKAISNLSSGGIVILEVTEKQSKYQARYLRLGSNMSATKVRYKDRYYLVIHSGEDYGN